MTTTPTTDPKSKLPPSFFLFCGFLGLVLALVIINMVQGFMNPDGTPTEKAFREGEYRRSVQAQIDQDRAKQDAALRDAATRLKLGGR